MILLMLRDGTYAEVPDGADVVHRNRSLRCINTTGEILASFNAAEVVAYTCSEASAQRFRKADKVGDHCFGDKESMMNLTTQDIEQLQGRPIFSSENDKVGDVDDVYLDDQTGKPEWARIGVGLFGMKNVLVPLGPLTEDGENLRAPYSKEMIKDAPRVEGDYISPAEESELYRYYGLDSASPSELNEMRGTPQDAMQVGPPVKSPEGEAPMSDAGRTSLADESVAGADGARLRRWTRL